jgi:hypothetical protein
MDPFFPTGVISLSANTKALAEKPKFRLNKCGSILVSRKDMMVDQTTSKTQALQTQVCLTVKSAKN